MNGYEKGQFFSAILGERAAQDDQWGGPEHDDTHDAWEWEQFIEYQAARLTHSFIPSLGECPEMPDYEQRLVKIGALACAAWESHRRKRAAVDTATEEGSPT